MTRLTWPERRNMLRLAGRLMCFGYMWRGRIYEDPLWKRFMVSLRAFVIGLPKLVGALIGQYHPDAVIPLYCWLLGLDTHIEKFLGIHKPSDGRIVDPRHRAAALEAIEESRAAARRMEAEKSLRRKE